ncbi:NAD(P)/FAD-dependent oxidoreductase [Sabulicella glaciei]|uniref:FAD-binding oxidoreductase n=1 Tax=Sabulicella glaciei TaxID=2984948 RepID=A0ABT3NV85_9PROT|nr:FAD-binding oxidoreductase [Roseococcus sp. MDT2-1-1]
MTRLAVIGGGIMGACLALEAQAAGFDVTLIEPGTPGGEQAASYGNGCWLSPASVIPASVPGLWRKLPKFLRDPLGPLAIRPGRLPAATPWLLRYLWAGSTEEKVRRTAHALRALLKDAPRRHVALAERAGVGALIRRTGLLYVFPDRAAFEAEALAWKLRAETGVQWRELDEDALRQQEPALDRRFRFGLLVEEGGHCTDPGAYVAALVALAEAQGARRIAARATGFRVENGALRAVRTESGEVEADKAVIAAGIRSAGLAREAGDRIPLESERGYHAVVTTPSIAPRIPLMPSDGKMGVTLTETGLRAAGQVEIAGLEAAPDWRRAEILRDHLRRLFPGLEGGEVKVWLGHRPSTPDGLPVLGPSRRSGDILHCFGHGHVGLVAAPRSAELVVGMAKGESAPVAYSPRRFG